MGTFSHPASSHHEIIETGEINVHETHTGNGLRVLLRPVTVDDAEATLQVVGEIAAEGSMFIIVPEELRTLEQQRKVLTDISPDDAFIVAEVDGQVVGFVDITRGHLAKTRHTATLGIGVAAAYRSKGLGSLLLGAAERWARQAGVKRIHFGVFATNERAVAAYLKCGYQKEGCLRGQIREGDRYLDEFWMGKWLENEKGERED
jgi:RimJ/RimL family protein N-acetyltransferase